MIERGIIEALHGAKPGSKQEVNGQALLDMLNAAKADGFKDPAVANDLRPIETVLTLPEGTIRLPDVRTLGMSNEELEKLADSTGGLNVGDWARVVIRRTPVPSEGPQTLSPVAMDARTMGLRTDCPTTKQVWERAKKYGDKITVEAMLQLVIEAAKGNIQVEIGKPLVGIMDPITDSHGRPHTLSVERHGSGLFVNARYAYPDRRWGPAVRFVVSPRK